MSNEITLGYDYSTGVKREDKEEYYRQEVAPETEIEYYNNGKINACYELDTGSIYNAR